MPLLLAPLGEHPRNVDAGRRFDRALRPAENRS
jgi:hypothetical protein